MFFTKDYKNSQFALNGTSIDDTDIPRSVAAIGRPFKSPIDVKLSGSPTLNSSDQSELYKYLQDVSNDLTFTTSVLQVLINERRSSP